SASVMAGFPGTADAIAYGRSHPDIGVGIHFNLTEGRALTGRSSLTDDSGEFHPGPEFRSRLRAGALRSQDIRAELAAQIDSILDRGIVLSHVDGHQHSHLLPVVAPIV